MSNHEPHFFKAVHLFNLEDESCSFAHGKLPARNHLPASHFFANAQIDEYQRHIHPAPRKQYVITLKGKLRFEVTNGDSFIIEPGVILIAEDTKGPGHTWTLIDTDEWVRMYIPIPEGADNQFIPDVTA